MILMMFYYTKNYIKKISKIFMKFDIKLQLVQNRNRCDEIVGFIDS